MQWELVRCFSKSRALCNRLRAGIPRYLGLREVLLKADNEPAIQALVDAVRGRPGERTMVEKSPKYSHQSNGAVENAVRIMEGLTRTDVCVLQRSLATKSKARALFSRGLSGTRRTCSVDL